MEASAIRDVFESRVRGLFEEVMQTYEGHWDAMRLNGACQFELDCDSSVWDCYLTISGGSLTLSDGRHPKPTTTVHMPIEDLLKFARGQGEINFAKVKVTGDISLLEPLLLRPALPEDRSRLAAAEEIARNYPTTAVEYLDRPSPATVLEALTTSKPLVIRGLLDHWPMMGWSFERLAGEYGDVVLDVVGKDWSTISGLARAISREETGDTAYTNGTFLPESLRVLFAPPLFDPKLFNPPQLWMGAAGKDKPNTGLHRDLFDGFLGQVIGRKHITFFSPDQAEFLYPLQHFRGHQRCWVKPWEPDLLKHPKFAQAQPIELELHPGELLIIPTGWFHCVRALDPTLSVSFFTKHGSLYADRATLPPATAPRIASSVSR